MATTISTYWIIMGTFAAPKELVYLVFLFHDLSS